jgi:hypothetical protein
MMLSGAELSNAALFLWQLHEASLFALGSLSEQLCEAQVDFFLPKSDLYYLCSAEQFINLTFFCSPFHTRKPHF